MEQSSTETVEEILQNDSRQLEAVDETAAEAARTLRRVTPYWFPYRTYAKERWWNREILELVSTEFRDRSVEYYRYALESGVVTINGKPARVGTIVRNGDRIENMVHRHEPPVTATPVKILLQDDEREIIVVDKPGSIPVHATGRYTKNSLIEILVNDFGYPKVYTVNRLDRLTSGCMIIALTSRRANLLCKEFVDGHVKKEYIARCSGEFPEEEIEVDQPLLTVDRQMGLNIVHPEGKYAKTTFKRLFYDATTNTSVLHCRPWTGRSHQIRVHLQFIGYPIANDPIYGDTNVWGKNGGKGGVSLEPSLSAPADIYFPAGRHQPNPHAPPPQESVPGAGADPVQQQPRSRLPREDGTDIGISSPVPLSSEAVSVITKLRSMKDQDEDYSRWRDVVFRAKNAEALNPNGLATRGDGLDGRGLRRAQEADEENKRSAQRSSEGSIAVAGPDVGSVPGPGIGISVENVTPTRNSANIDPNLASAKSAPPAPRSESPAVEVEGSYCPECYLPLLPDPKPEKLFIFLHAWRYTTKEWSFSTEMPFWAAKGYCWQREAKYSATETPSSREDPVAASDPSTVAADAEVRGV